MNAHTTQGHEKQAGIVHTNGAREIGWLLARDEHCTPDEDHQALAGCSKCL